MPTDPQGSPAQSPPGSAISRNTFINTRPDNNVKSGSVVGRGKKQFQVFYVYN